MPLTQRTYTNSEDGMYGPAIDNDFANNKWVYLFYSPQTVTDVKLSDGSIVTQTTPNTTPPVTSPTKTAWDPYVGYFQLSRFKFIEDASARGSTSARSSRSCASRSTARSAATSRVTSTSTSTTTCGWLRATTTPRAASTAAATGR